MCIRDRVKEYCATWEEHKRLDYHKTILEVLEKNPDADGIFCNGDAMALQTIQILSLIHIYVYKRQGLPCAPEPGCGIFI